MGEVDPAFIQEPEHRPRITYIEGQGIPLIDLSPIHSSGDVSALVKEIGNACKEWGFFQVINHGVILEKRQKIEDVSRKFFAQSLDDKRKVRRTEKVVLGYYDTEHTKNVRDWKEVFDYNIEEHTNDKEVTAEWTNLWPEYPPEFREICQEYAQEMVKLAFKLMAMKHGLMELVALSLGLPSDRFHGFFKDQTNFVQFNRYRTCPNPHLALGVGRHKDSGALTILVEDDVGGLEVKPKTYGEWIRVKPIPNAYIINIGDTIKVWSNDKYESVEHRVIVNSERDRFSIPFFFLPALSTMVKPLEELTNEQNPVKYRAYNWGEFISTRMQSNFQKLYVENLQINHFKTTD